jgi:phosphohistidine phosphatase SixA
MPQQILVSPAIRCRATVEPLGFRLGIVPEEEPRLGETATEEDLAELASRAVAAPGTFVMCGHAPSLIRLAQVMAEAQVVAIGVQDLQLDIASVLEFEFSADFSRRLVTVIRRLAPDYAMMRLFG